VSGSRSGDSKTIKFEYSGNYLTLVDVDSYITKLVRKVNFLEVEV
jgi:hypothetical protein